MRVAARRQQGLVLASVLFFVLLTVSTIATFQSRATVDGLIARNRDFSSRCEALARGGVQLGVALLLQDRLDEQKADFRSDSVDDVWATVGGFETPDGGRLRLRIEDTSARVNLNALLGEDGQARDELSELFLAEILSKIVEEMPGRPEEKIYDPLELAQNLIDFIDRDDVSVRGEAENDYYQSQKPPYEAANRPFLSIEEVGRVEGFDRNLVEALRPYATVHPIAGADGVNPNTAPAWVLASLYHGAAGDFQMAREDDVRRILDIRESGGILCSDDADVETCTPIRDALPGEIFPPPTYSSDVFRITAEARYGDVKRTVEAVVDRSDVMAPAILSWRVR